MANLSFHRTCATKTAQRPWLMKNVFLQLRWRYILSQSRWGGYKAPRYISPLIYGMKMLRLLAALLLVLATAGCATPYQPFELFGRGGYQERKLTHDTYEVIYYGNHVTSMETLNSLLLYRSAEVTLNSGYDSFEIVSGVATMPLSTLGGFRTARHTIRMYSGQAAKNGPNTYVARNVVAELGPHVGKQK